MDISLKVHKNQDPHNEAIKNISTVFKKKMDYKLRLHKTEYPSLSK